jgi:hypothetical protein
MTKISAAARPLQLMACAGAAAAFLGLAPQAAQAAQIQNSGSIFTSRPCPNVPATSPCNINGVPRNFTQLNGGFGQPHSDSVSNAFGSWAAKVGFTNSAAYSMPVIGVRSAAGPNTRVGSSATGFRSYRNDTPWALDLSFDLRLDYTNSDDQAGEGEYREGHLNAAFGVFQLSSFASLANADANTMVSNPNAFPTCGVAGTLAAADMQSVFGGAHHDFMTFNQGCGGGKITVGAGQEFVIVATLQAISNRGGFINAMHTFEVQVDEEHTFISGTDTVVDAQALRQSFVSDIPEPATWAMMLAGFAGLGGMLRRRRAVAA